MAARDAISLPEADGRRLLDGLQRIESGEVRGKGARGLASVLDSALAPATPRPTPAVSQFALRVRFLIENGVVLKTAPARGPVWEHDYFDCLHFRSSPTRSCLLEVRTCLMRQGAKWPGGNRAHKTHGPSIPKKAGVHPYCASGQCAQGKDLRARCTFRPEDVWSKGRYHTWRPDTHDQRVAMKAWERGRILEPRVEQSPLQVAAGMTPDDKALP